MDTESNIKLIEKMFHNRIIFEKNKGINDYNILICKDYDNMNLFICSKKFNEKIDQSNFIKQLSKIDIRETLFDSYFEIEKISDTNENSWTEKLIYNKKNYNIQRFLKSNKSLLCYSDIDLDDDSYEYLWINNPFTLINFDSNEIYLKIAFEISNNYQNEILKNFLTCLDKLEIALSS